MGSKLVILDPVVEIAGVDWSDQFNSAEITIEREGVEATTFGAKADAFEKGKYQNGLTLNYRPDGDFAKWRTLSGYVDGAATTAIAIKFKNEDASVTNPEAKANVHFLGAPFGGGHGAIQEGQLTPTVNGAWTVHYDETDTDKDVFG